MLMTKVQFDKKGALHLTFDDVAAVRADTIYIDKSTHEISALIDGWVISLGALPKQCLNALKTSTHVVLNALHPQGHNLELVAALQKI